MEALHRNTPYTNLHVTLLCDYDVHAKVIDYGRIVKKIALKDGLS